MHICMRTLTYHTHVSRAALNRCNYSCFVSCQILGLLQNVSNLYPNSLQTFLNGYLQTTSSKAFVSLDCSLPVYTTASKATITTLITALQPAYVALAAWVFWLVFAIYAYCRAR